MLLTLFSTIGLFVVDLAIFCGAIFLAVNITGEMSSALEQFGQRAFWERHLVKAIWLTAIMSGAWAAYSLYSLTLIPSLLSVFGFLVVQAIAAFAIVCIAQSRAYDAREQF